MAFLQLHLLPPIIQFCPPCLPKFCPINRPKVVSLFINGNQSTQRGFPHQAGLTWSLERCSGNSDPKCLSYKDSLSTTVTLNLIVKVSWWSFLYCTTQIYQRLVRSHYTFFGFSRQGFSEALEPVLELNLVDQAGLKHKYLPVSAFQVLGLKVCTTTTQLGVITLWEIIQWNQFPQQIRTDNLAIN